MERMHFEIKIDAPREKVWKTMLENSTYRQWTAVFMKGSHFEGDWSEGSKMRFLAPSEKGEVEGMVSRVIENRPNEFVSVEHIGFVQDGKDDTTSDEVKKWAGAHENYTLEEKNGKTLLKVDLDSPTDEYKDMLEEAWPKALQKLKELAEE